MADDFDPNVFNPASKPAFTDASKAAATPYCGSPDEIPTFDRELETESPEAPSRGIITRYREIARLHAFGKTNNEICALLGYTPSRMSIILTNPFVQEEIQKWRDQLVDDDAIGIMKNAARDGARRIHAFILNPKTRDTVAMDASKFAVEKTHGKARQEVSVESGTLSTFMDMLKEMKSRGEPLDVTPTGVPALAGPSEDKAAAPQNEFDDWLDENL